MRWSYQGCLDKFVKEHFAHHADEIHSQAYYKVSGTLRACPRHRCKACGAKEMNDKMSRFHRCVRCPLAYHRRCMTSFGYLTYH